MFSSYFLLTIINQPIMKRFVTFVALLIIGVFFITSAEICLMRVCPKDEQAVRILALLSSLSYGWIIASVVRFWDRYDN